ncbi:hypothetical protein QBC36DRAFT_388826 [Triangularia setosa]|uniref:Heterokaryon incompatibility domain-containing protein n=1 Tax=Triangularia setosa TaxID=2587417 RepID=A0AAN6W6U6_9PEZI|nr:hypothetical protein QBC36DRAFT_388826 [Podospora setosa]
MPHLLRLEAKRPTTCDDGIWVDVQSQGQTTLAIHAYLDQLYEAAEDCINCAVIIEALEAFEGDSPNIGNNGYVFIKGHLQYQFDDDYEYYFIEIFKITGGKRSCFAYDKLESCVKSHSECRSNSSSQLPARVIQVGSETQPPRLTLTTTKATYSDRLKEIRWNDIPKTIREAVEFTQHLGVPYIWDDNDDWEREAAKMQSVYENALFTLSATSSPDTVTGCFLPRTPTYELGSAKPSHTYYARRACTFTHDKLFNNGGDLERLLSKRILYATFDELLWECSRSIDCECTPSGQNVWLRPRSGDAESHNSNSAMSYAILRMWFQLFTHYSDRRFQNLNVKLGVYLAGIWSKNIHHQLAWRRLSTSVNAVKRPEFGPSWSWAGFNLPCRFGYMKLPEDVTTRLKLVGYDIKLKSEGNPLGGVERARLRLEGACVDAGIELKDGKGVNGMKRVYVTFQGRSYPVTEYEVVCLELYHTRTATIKLRDPEERVAVNVDEPWSEIRSGEVYYDYRFPWLVLKRDSGGGQGAYRRVGLLDFDNLLGLGVERHAPGEMVWKAMMRVLDIV